MKITTMNGNARNKIKGSRVTIKADDGTIIDRFVVPVCLFAERYCKDHPKGTYGKRYAEAVQIAATKDKEACAS